MRKFVIGVLLLALLAGCTASYVVNDIDRSGTKLSREDSFYVMLPANGEYSGKVYPNSGRDTAQSANAALSKYANTVQQASAVESLNEAMAQARARGLNHVFDAQILHWEDRATEWSGIPDQVDLKLIVYETASGTQVASTTVHGNSKWATFGGDHPQDLAHVLIQEFVKQLF